MSLHSTPRRLLAEVLDQLTVPHLHLELHLAPTFTRHLIGPRLDLPYSTEDYLNGH